MMAGQRGPPIRRHGQRTWLKNPMLYRSPWYSPGRGHVTRWNVDLSLSSLHLMSWSPMLHTIAPLGTITFVHLSPEGSMLWDQCKDRRLG